MKSILKSKLVEGRDISDKLHEASKNKKLIKDAVSYPDSWINIHFKTYPRMDFIALSTSGLHEKNMKLRRSRRDFSNKSISLDTLGFILKSSSGLMKRGKNLNDSRRPYPSAGARYPLEVYVVALKAKGLKKGLYHYNVRDNCLEILLEKDLRDCILDISGKEEWLLKSSIIIFITGVMNRTKVKYQERGHRYVLIETGHLAQNILLLAQDMGIKSCPIGGFIDDKVIDLLDLRQVKEYPLYMIALGK